MSLITTVNNICWKFKDSTKSQRKFAQKNDLEFDVLKKNKLLKNRFQGQRCFIVGNGPSTKNQDLSLLKNEFVFTVNYGHKMSQFKDLHSNFHFYTDESCFLECVPIEYFSNIKTADNTPLLFCNLVGKSFLERHKLDKLFDVYYLFNYFSINNDAKLHTEIDQGITGFYTVVQTAIITAIYMGFSKVYLLGCDCTGIIASINAALNQDISPAYSYELDGKDKILFDSLAELGITMQQTFAGWANIFKGYHLLNQYFRQRDIQLVNLTNEGILDEVPKMRYEDIIARE